MYVCDRCKDPISQGVLVESNKIFKATPLLSASIDTKFDFHYHHECALERLVEILQNREGMVKRIPEENC